jgi:hypothetical protein
MKVIERDWKYSKMFDVGVKAYDQVDEKYLNFKPGIRVLPAPFFEEPSIEFKLRKRFEPGEKATFPNGGFEVYGPGGEIRSYELDQVIVHPYALGQRKFFTKNLSEDKKLKEIDPNAPKRKRGRPSDPNKEPRPVYVPTGKKRGRPSNPNTQPRQPYVPTGGKRGRPKKQN